MRRINYYNREIDKALMTWTVFPCQKIVRLGNKTRCKAVKAVDDFFDFNH